MFCNTGLLPVAYVLHAVLHGLVGGGDEQSNNAPRQITRPPLLLLNKYDAGMVATRSHPFAVQFRKVTYVTRHQDASLLCGKLKLILVLPVGHSRLAGG